MKIALTVDNLETDSVRDSILTTYIAYVYRLGHIPVLIPNSVPDVSAYLDALAIDGIILSGGGDIHPARYKQPNTHSKEISIARDSTEWALLTYAIERELPVMGICRGHQVINVFFGGSLIQDIPSKISTPAHHNSDTETHLVMITDTKIETVLGHQEVIVNSRHHQGVTPDLVAEPLSVFAISPCDDLVEGLLHREYPIISVQWHPERADCPSNSLDIVLFQRLFDEGAFWLNGA